MPGSAHRIHGWESTVRAVAMTRIDPNSDSRKEKFREKKRKPRTGPEFRWSIEHSYEPLGRKLAMFIDVQML